MTAPRSSEARSATGEASTRRTPAAATRPWRRLMTATEIREAFERWRALDPAPATELDYTSPFELLVAVVLSAQSTDAGVNKVTARLFPVANTPARIVELGVEGLRPYLASIGLYNAKSANVVALSERLLADHGGVVPRTREALEALPGVGRKTANVLLNVVHGEPTLAVDTHVFRVANRTGMAPATTPRKVEDRLLKRIPQEFLQHAHHWLILHGRHICTARAPRCGDCPVADLCQFRGKH